MLNKNKTLLLVIIAISIFCFYSITNKKLFLNMVYCEPYTDTDASYFDFDPSTQTIKYKTGEVPALGPNFVLNIPNQINGVNVKKIGDYGFSGNDAAYNIGSNIKQNLKKVVIPNTVEEIGNFAFEYCENLDEIVFSSTSNLKSVGEYAFQGCKTLPSINFPAGLETVGQYAFFNCIALGEKIIIPENIKSLGQHAFHGCANLKEVEIKQGKLEEIDCGLFNSSGLEKISLPEGIKKFKDYAFEACLNLEEIKIPSTVTEIGDYAFQACNKLKTITIPDNTKLGKSLFKENFDSIGNTNVLEEIHIKGIGCIINSNAFANAGNKLSDIYLLDSPKNQIANSPWGSGLEDKNIHWKEFVFDDNGKLLEYNGNKTEVTIPGYTENQKKVIEIADNVFKGRNDITKITLPINLEVIGKNAFKGCNFGSINLPGGIKKIMDNAFENCSSLENIEIPSSIKEIDKNIFSGCNKLESITVLASDGAVDINSSAFANISNLKDIYFPNATTDSILLKPWESNLADKNIHWKEDCYKYEIIPNLNNPIDFGKILEGEVVEPKSFKIKNTGCYDYNLNINITGDSEKVFEIQGDSSNVLHNGDSIDFVLSVKNNIKVGEYTAKLNIENDKFSQELDIKLIVLKEYVIDDQGFIIKYNGKNKNLVIPKKIDGIDIIGIKKEAFADSNDLESIVIPGQPIIENKAFEKNIKLKYIYFIDALENSVAGYENKWGAPTDTEIYWKSFEIIPNLDEIIDFGEAEYGYKKIQNKNLVIKNKSKDDFEVRVSLSGENPDAFGLDKDLANIKKQEQETFYISPVVNLQPGQYNSVLEIRIDDMLVAKQKVKFKINSSAPEDDDTNNRFFYNSWSAIGNNIKDNSKIDSKDIKNKNDSDYMTKRKLSDIKLPDEIKSKKFINGYPDKTFKPENNLTCAEFAQMIYKLTSDTDKNNSKNLDRLMNFDKNAWYSDAIAYLTNKKIISGYENKFDPNNFITRAEVAQILFNALKFYDNNFSGSYSYGIHKYDFSDLSDCENNSICEIIKQLASNGMLNGYEDGTFRPNKNVNRAEAVAMISKVFDRYLANNIYNKNKFIDLDESHWAFKYIVNAIE